MRFLITLVLLLSPPAWAAISLDNHNAQNSASGTTNSFSYTTAANAIMVVGVWCAAGTSTVTYNAVSLTNAFTGTDMSIWYLLAPASGAHTLTATLAGAGGGSRVGVQTLLGAATAPIGASAGAIAISTSVTTSIGGAWVMDYIEAAGAIAPGLSASNGQTVDNTLTGGTSVLFEFDSAHLVTTAAGSYTLGWSATGSATTRETAVLEIRPATTSGFWFLLVGQTDPLKALFDFFIQPVFADDFRNQKRNAWNSHPLEYRSASR